VKRSDASRRASLIGTSQRERLLQALVPGYVKLDERTISDWLVLVTRMAEHIQYYDQHNLPAGDWAPFLRNNYCIILAEILSLDLQKLDKEILRMLRRTRQYSHIGDKAEEYCRLLDRFLDLVRQIDYWQIHLRQTRKWKPPSRLEQELDSAISHQLSNNLGILFAKIDVTASEGLLELQDQVDLEAILDSLDPIWKKGIKTSYQSYTDNGKRIRKKTDGLHWDDQDAKYDYLIGEVRQVYKKYHQSLSFIQQLADKALKEAMETQHDHAPHIGLLLSFLHLYGFAQEHLNTLTGRHLDYYYQNILQLKPREGIPDHSVVCFELAEHVPYYSMPEGTLFLAGVNEEGRESHYRTTSHMLVTKAKIASLKTIFIGKNRDVGIGSAIQLISGLYAAPAANSADGIGKPFVADNASWPIVGEDQLIRAENDRQMINATCGFAIASSLFLLEEGVREIKIELQFSTGSFRDMIRFLEDIRSNQNLKGKTKGKISEKEKQQQYSALFNKLFLNALDVFITGEESWLSVSTFRLEPPKDWKDSYLNLHITLPVSFPAVVGFNPEVLADNFDTKWPMVKVLLSAEDSIFVYSFLKELQLEEVRISVDVKGLRSISLYNDIGPVDATAPFAPFGSVPHRNSYLLIGNSELFKKKLDDLQLSIEWNNLPAESGGFSKYYEHYPDEIQNESFKVELSALSDYQFNPLEANKQVFNLFKSAPPPEDGLASRTVIEDINFKLLQITPDYQMGELPEYTNRTKSGYFKLKMNNPPMVFGHEIYPRLFARAIAENAKMPPFSLLPKSEEEPVPLPSEPFIPVIQRLTVNYKASSKINFRQLEFRENNLPADEKIFQLHPFGQEPIYSKGKANSLSILPVYDEQGYLFIGLEGLQPPEPLSLFFDIQESKAPSSHSRLYLEWSYLVDNRWIPFGQEKVLSDTTASLSTSGIVRLAIPEEINRNSTILPADYYWIRVSALGNLSNIGRAKMIKSQAAEVVWVKNGDPAHYHQLATADPIAELLTPVPEISDVQQVMPFYGGRPAETKKEFYIRVSERLRHKNRASQVWDYERLVLQEFPEIQQAKSIGPSNYPALPPGQVKIVIIPTIDGVDPEPKAGFHLIKQVEAYLRERCSPFVKMEVINPVYEHLRISCAVKFRPEVFGQKGQYIQQLHDELANFICPWLTSGNIQFGGRIPVHGVLSFIKERPYIQFVTRFSLVHVQPDSKQVFSYKISDTAQPQSTTDVIEASLPWSVLVPTRLHQFILVEEESYIPPEIASIESMRLETDFIVVDGEQSSGMEFKKPDTSKPEDEDDQFSLDDIVS
jgi:hypothetical protein